MFKEVFKEFLTEAKSPYRFFSISWLDHDDNSLGNRLIVTKDKKMNSRSMEKSRELISHYSSAASVHISELDLDEVSRDYQYDVWSFEKNMKTLESGKGYKPFDIADALGYTPGQAPSMI